MSKAEEKAMQYCCTKCANNKLNCGMKLISHGRNCIECSNYIEGYRQAEKDLKTMSFQTTPSQTGLEEAEKDNELTWEDISIIRQIMFNYNRTIRNEMAIPNDKEYCQEVLKRYKENR